ncbi:hypothetical protein FAES_2478 [Fibrella aestuarina BUZ 2]|uniref:Uncharacterized protein n=1 Tax=Fibrella aestuarina BUZ 2 TaxID=1166018 RepID=I0K8N4_9BACT|nr:hypothetical protein FAES_2478 [Fibrella aestuarina BUZ 2]
MVCLMLLQRTQLEGFGTGYVALGAVAASVQQGLVEQTSGNFQ